MRESEATRRLLFTRSELDALIAPPAERTWVACRRALRDAGVQASGLDGVILVGGATRVRQLRDYVGQAIVRTAKPPSTPSREQNLGVARGLAGHLLVDQRVRCFILQPHLRAHLRVYGCTGVDARTDTDFLTLLMFTAALRIMCGYRTERRQLSYGGAARHDDGRTAAPWDSAPV
ncbi:Hsp70 family protein [Sorangium sp. So ce295]|uniref:Hsp70 family protein n=1 Tax=Sorangium sp. So ce295 TaxID=3133295 RepID=UPI003F6285A8